MSTKGADLPKLENIVAIATGERHHLALSLDGTVIAWGDNSYGQTDVPETLSDIVFISSGGNHSLALRTDGKVFAWGSNLNGQVNVPHHLLNGVMKIRAGWDASLAIMSDGTAVHWGGFASGGHKGMRVPGFKIIDAAVGDGHLLALFDDGDTSGFAIPLPNVYKPIERPKSNNRYTQISAGSGFVVALTREGTVECWGRNDYGQSTPPPGLNSVIAVSAGGGSALALLSDGTVRGWAGLEVPSDLNDVVAIAAGNTSLALKRDGSVVAFGD